MKKSKSKKKTEPKLWEFSVDGLTEYLIDHLVTQKYSDRINNRILSEYGVIEEIISHSPSIGNYYERLLVSNLQNYLPTKWKIGTGFVFDDYTASSSPQIDIIVYEDIDRVPIFQAGDLVVVRPDQVHGIIEVKKRLKLDDIGDLIEKYLFSNTGSEFCEDNGIQVLNIFSYEKATSIEKYYDRIIAALTLKLESLVLERDGNQKKLRHLKSITIPRVYFLQDNMMIDSRLDKKGMAHKIAVSIQGILYSSGGASDLFSRFIWNSSKDEFGRIRFSTVQLYEPGKTKSIDVPIILRKFSSTREVCFKFSKEEFEKVDAKIKKEVSGFYVPYGFSVKTAEGLKKYLLNGTINPIIKSRKSKKTVDQ